MQTELLVGFLLALNSVQDSSSEADKSFLQHDARPADVLIAEAQSKARTEGKSVMLFYSATWCGACKILWKEMHEGAMKEACKSSFVLVKLYMSESKSSSAQDNPSARDYAMRYARGGTGIPYWVVIDPTGNAKVDSIHQDRPPGGREYLSDWANLRGAVLASPWRDRVKEVERLDKVYRRTPPKLAPGLGDGSIR